mgnify:CR=1 FL=1
MLDEEDGNVELVADAADGLRQLCGLGGIHAGGRLVQKQQLRLVASARMISRRRCAP